MAFSSESGAWSAVDLDLGVQGFAACQSIFAGDVY